MRFKKLPAAGLAVRTPALFAALCNRLSEYAEPLFLTTGRAAYFAEHYRTVLSKDVLNSLAKL